ncbi:MAG: NAD-dependent epimerase/dehydratase family protein [Methylococcaceae bacterium]|nr:MAG: NAD-dependent epimerase/dehydratase family protein [Methylococcaceae bacterium]
MNTKFLVLGSNSFSGASFTDYLLEQGHTVVGTSRSPEPVAAFLPYRWQPQRADDFSFHQLDLNHDLDALMALIEQEQPGYVVNFAAQSMVGESWKNPDHWFMTNLVSTVRLHERLRHCKFLRKYVHITTPEVYGSTAGFIAENTPFNPSTPYAVSRAAADMSLHSYFAAYDFPVVFTRAANVFGPGQQLYRIVPRTILFIRLGRKLQLHGGGYSERSFIHIRDVSDATLRVALDGRPGDTYHISTSRIVTIRALVELICERLGVRFADCVEEVGERLGKDAAYQLDSGKIRRELGWSGHVTLEQGIDETIAWVDRWFDVLKDQPCDYLHKP